MDLMSHKRILGIDPGTLHTGYAIIDVEENQVKLLACGVVHPSKKLLLEERCFEIYLAIQKLIAEFQPDACSIEAQFVGQINPSSALKIGWASSAASIAATQAGLTIHFYFPVSIKKALCGNGKATKETMQRFAKMRFGLLNIPEEDACDAIGAAMCLAQKMEPSHV